jgi:predicted TIM-barrel fold metal-dependent hydrolase
MSHMSDLLSDASRYLLISTDGHCGADLLDYKPYLERRFHDDFDTWAAAYEDPWAAVDATRSANNRAGLNSSAATLNWDGQERLIELDDQGIAVEVLFPNTAPPFYPANAISAPGPVTREEYEYRSAGVRAHNRWLADFCAQAPDRRIGFAQVFLDDVDAAVSEARWAKEAGLRGILLPSDHVLRLQNLYYPRYDALWAVCEELELPVHRHPIMVTESVAEGGMAAPLIGPLEASFYVLRGIGHMIIAGVFERYPGLKFVTTEAQKGRGVLPYLEELDKLMDSAAKEGTVRFLFSSEARQALRKRPSEYFASNCYVAAPLDFRLACEAGVPNLMWGADLPHSEGTSPFTSEALRWSMRGFTPAQVENLVTTVAADVYDLDVDALRPIADRIGPTVAEIATPLSAQEWPDFPDATRCPLWEPENRPASLVGTE